MPTHFHLTSWKKLKFFENLFWAIEKCTCFWGNYSFFNVHLQLDSCFYHFKLIRNFMTLRSGVHVYFQGFWTGALFTKTSTVFLTALSQNVYVLLKYDNPTNMPPMTFLFQWDIGYINMFFGEKVKAPRKTTFGVCFFEKIGKKQIIGPKNRNFENKKAKNRCSEAPDPKIILEKLSVKIFFEKLVLRLTAKNDISLKTLTFGELFLRVFCISSPIRFQFPYHLFWRQIWSEGIIINFQRVRACCHACAGTTFSRASPAKRCHKAGFREKKIPKIVVRECLIEIFGEPMCFDRKFFQNDFGAGAFRTTIFWPFFRFSKIAIN